MNKDFRVSITFADHPKTHKLMRRCGDKACWCLMRFWGFVAANRPNGVLSELDVDDIEIASGWDGEAGKFLEALIALRFVDVVDGVYHAHDWMDHNEYAAHAKARSDKASAAARARWGNAQPCSEHATSNAQPCSELCPSPSPIPAPNPNPKDSLTPPPSYPEPRGNSGGGVSDSDFEAAEQEMPDDPERYPEEFQNIVAAYPKHRVDIVPAYAEYERLRKRRDFSWHRLETDLSKRTVCDDWTRSAGQFVPALSRYLRERQWMNPIPEARAAPPGYALSAEDQALANIVAEARAKREATA